MPSPEQLFVSYRDRGDMQALAAVFDATAPQLLLVAGHLVRDGALAEDLLQTTFVEAMRCAGRYDARRPLLPWLASILTNQARKLRRARKRTPDPGRLRAREVERPFADAEAGEVLAAVQQALERLPVAYRQVLTLRLVHELPPAAIAHALGTPPETVKTRLKRGMEQLRRQLPKGLGVLLAAAATNGRGLAAVRRDVLQSATKATRLLPWTLASIGVLIMKKVTIAIMATAVLALASWWGSEAFGAPPVGEATTLAVPARAAGDPAAEGGDAAAAAARREVCVAEQADKVVFRGRCVEAATGRPLAGCAAQLWCRSDQYATHLPANAQTLTADDGCFEISVAQQRDDEYFLRVGDEKHVARSRAFGPWQRARTIDLGDVEMRGGVQLSGRVLDRKGQPVAGVDFRLRPQAAWFASYEGFPEAPGWLLRSGADGSYATETAIPGGRLELMWTIGSLPAERMFEWLTVPETEGPQTLDLVFPIDDDKQSIRGRLLDGDGAPLRPLDLRALGGGTLGTCQCDVDGNFAIPRIEPYDPAALGPVALTLSYPIEGYVLCDPVICSWGDRDVLVRVRPAQTLTVKPVDPRSHALLRDYELLCFEVMAGNGDEQVLPGFPVTKRLPDGSSVLTLSENDHVLQVLPRDTDLGPSPLLRRARSDGSECTIELPLSSNANVLVVTADGVPIAGSEVWSLRAADAAASAELPDPQVLRLAAKRRFSHCGVSDQPVDHGVTDGDGRVHLRTIAGAAMVFAALGPGHVSKAVAMHSAGAADVRIVVAPGASLQCRFAPTSVIAAYSPTPRSRQWAEQLGDADGPVLLQHHQVQVHLDRAAAEQQQDHWQYRTTMVVSAEGLCRCDGLPPGHYDVLLEARRPFDGREGALVSLSLGTVLLRDGETTELVHDLSGLMPCQVRGQVFLNGEPWAHGTGCLATRLGSKHVSSEIATDAQGRFASETVPGSMRLQLYYRHSDNMGYWFAPEEIQVTPGHITDAVFAVRRVEARVRILTADGQPAPGLQVTMDTEGQPRGWQSWTTDESGAVVIDPAPIKPFALVVHSPNAATGLAARLPGAAADALLGTFRIPPAGTRASFEARLPDGWR